MDFSRPPPGAPQQQQHPRPPTVDAAVSPASPVRLKRESSEVAIDALGAPPAGGGEAPPSQSRDPRHSYMSGQAGAGATVAAQSAAAGLQTPARPMGGEGAPLKGPPLSLDAMDNPPMAFNHHTRDGGAGGGEDGGGGGGGGGARGAGGGAGVLGPASIELSHEGKWKNVRKTSPHPAAQASCLRQILLLQLDLIEQQQQQLQSKDREIEELKNDKETLLARIERMERRLQLTRKDPPRDKRLFQPLEPWTPGKEDMWDLEVEDTSQHSLTTPLSPGRGGDKTSRSRKPSPGDPRPQKCRSKSLKESPQKAEVLSGSRECVMEVKTEREALPLCKEEQDCSFQIDDLPFMSTTEMYLCCSNPPPLSPLRETSPKKEEEVAIPSWRENSIAPLPVDPSYDALEPMDDGSFLKRHLKLELDEKRRKRWDIQRIREQRMFQRLQLRMNRKKVVTDNEPDIASFYPDTEDVESIEVTPFLPVVAFGRPLPKLTPENFELPWLDERSRCRIEVPKKQTPHRTCRK